MNPSFTVETVKGTPCTHNPLGLEDVPMPASPYNVWKAAQAAAR